MRWSFVRLSFVRSLVDSFVRFVCGWSSVGRLVANKQQTQQINENQVRYARISDSVEKRTGTPYSRTTYCDTTQQRAKRWTWLPGTDGRTNEATDGRTDATRSVKTTHNAGVKRSNLANQFSLAHAAGKQAGRTEATRTVVARCTAPCCVCPTPHCRLACAHTRKKPHTPDE